MTREEEIKRASIMYHIYQYDNSYEEGETLDFYIKGFIEGAKWADTHPVIWHDVSEMPKEEEWFLAQIGDDAFDTFIMNMEKEQDWRCWAKGMNFKRWAYISDLLPKGGKR